MDFHYYAKSLDLNFPLFIDLLQMSIDSRQRLLLGVRFWWIFVFFFVARALKSAASSQRTVEQSVRALQGVVME